MRKQTEERGKLRRKESDTEMKCQKRNDDNIRVYVSSSLEIIASIQLNLHIPNSNKPGPVDRENLTTVR